MMLVLLAHAIDRRSATPGVAPRPLSALTLLSFRGDINCTESSFLWYPAKVSHIVGALQGFLAEHFTPIRKPICIQNMNLLDFPPFSFAARVY
jgi:hypothetical protein